MSNYKIGEMAKLLDISPSALRYYDKEGLLPFTERSKSGERIFKDEDYEWLKIIICLKKAGMPLKSIREFVLMSMEGDNTIDGRLELIKGQRKTVLEKISEYQKMLEILDYKCWFYETAKKFGSTSFPREMNDSELPDNLARVRRSLKKSENYEIEKNFAKN